MTENYTYPITVLGGGIAGCAVATLLSQAGWKVALLERDEFPRDKLCGEFLSGESISYLRQLGCLDRLLAFNPPEMDSARFISQRGKTISVPLPQKALGLSRSILDQNLFEHACSNGVNGFTSCNVRDIDSQTSGERYTIRTTTRNGDVTFDSILTIGAYGRLGTPDRELNRSFLSNVDDTIGIKMHLRLARDADVSGILSQLAKTTEVYGLNGGYCGLSLIEGNRVNLCMLLRKSTFQRMVSADWTNLKPFLSSENVKLADILAMLEPVEDSLKTVYRMPFGAKKQVEDGIFFVGDAAGMIAPLCGDGQAMALESASLLANLIISTFPEPNKLDADNLRLLQSQWPKVWEEQFRQRITIGYNLQKVFLNPSLAAVTMSALNMAPKACVNWLVSRTRGTSI